MLDLGEELRSFIDSGAAPVSVREVFERNTTIAVVRQTPARPSSSRGTRYSAVTLAVVALAAGLLAFGLSISPSGVRPGTPGASAAVVLTRAANEAANSPPLVPSAGQFLYVSTLVGGRGTAGNGKVNPAPRIYTEELVQIWTSPTVPGTKTSQVVGQPRFISAADRAAWEAEGSPPLETGYGGGGDTPYYDVLNLPTDPWKISAYFAAQPYLTVTAPYGRSPAWLFDVAVKFLQNGASSRQRAALLRFMATIPGVKDLGGGVTIGTGQRGTVLSLPADHPGLAEQAVLDPVTSEVLEERWIVTDTADFFTPTSSQLQAGQAIAPLADGQATDYVDFVYDGIADSDQSVPPGPPPTPAPWPVGTSREPLPGSAFP